MYAYFYRWCLVGCVLLFPRPLNSWFEHMCSRFARHMAATMLFLFHDPSPRTYIHSRSGKQSNQSANELQLNACAERCGMIRTDRALSAFFVPLLFVLLLYYCTAVLDFVEHLFSFIFRLIKLVLPGCVLCLRQTCTTCGVR